MNFTKLKKIACITLATVMTFSNLQMPIKEVQAKTVTNASQYANFADAVKAMYDGKTDQVNGDYELASFSGNYEYSVAKKSINTYYSANENVNTYQKDFSLLWDERSSLSGGTTEATHTSSIRYLKKENNVSLENVGVTSPSSSQNNWDYDVVELAVNRYSGAGGSLTYGKVAVNVRPSTPISGAVTLPAYINDKQYGMIECVELGDGAFLQDEDLTEVNIPDTYQRICAYAFTGCTNLEKVRFVTTTKTNVGTGYTIDTTQSNDSNLHMLGTGAFAGCKQLKSALLPENLLEGYMYVAGNDIKGYAGSNNGSLSYKDGRYVSSNIGYFIDHVDTGYLKKSGDAIKYGTYYMGQGVYRDCYDLTSVEITGVNPYIPSLTFAGCAKISEIKIADSVKNIAFGVASFAGADGNNASEEKSGLKTLDLTSENLESVNIGAYAFKNCYSLQNVTITAALNTQPNLTNIVQGTYFTTENAFENSFAENGSFTYSPKSCVDFKVPVCFFKNCKNLKNISIMDNLTKDADTNTSYTLKVGEKAFEGIGCENLTLAAQSLWLETGSLNGLSNTDTLTLGGHSVMLIGEPFSNTNNNFKTTLLSSLKNINFDSTYVTFTSAELSASPISTKFYTSASFYGVGSDTILTFTENVVGVQGSASNLEATSIQYTANGKTETHDLYHSGLGEISKVYFKGCSTTLNNDDGTKGASNSLFEAPLSGYSSYEYADVNKDLNTVIYADGKTYDAANNLVKRVNSSRLKASEYLSSILKNSMEWIETEHSFNPENLNDGKGLYVQYADGSTGYIPYAKDEQAAGANDGTNGFIISNLEQITNEIANGAVGKEIAVSVKYRGKVGVIYATIVAKQATDFEVKQTNNMIIAGTSPKNTDVEFLSVSYNDGTRANTISDTDNYTVSLATGNTYTAGENLLNVTYMGCTKQISVFAEEEKVVSLSAIQTKTTLYPGDKLTKNDFEVTAYYNSGKIVADYTDYDIENSEILTTTNNVKLTSTDGAEVIVPLNVSTLEPKSLSVLYNGTAVQQGTDVQKKDFSVTLIYENDAQRVLTEDEYMLVYDMIVAGNTNEVQVVYKLDPEIRQTVYVMGVMDAVTNAPNISDTPSTTTPDTGKDNIATTNAPADDATNAPASSADVTSPTVQNTAAPSNTPVVPVTVDTNNIPSAVTTGSSVSSSSEAGVSLKNTNTNLTLGVGEKVKISIAGASDLTYQTSDDSILSVTKEGVVKAKKVGKASIIVTNTNGNTMTCTITVKKAPKKVKVNFTKKTLKKGKKAKIKVSFAKGYYSRTRTFKSSNKKVATVNQKGVITANKKGTCKITVKAFNGKKAVITIKVK